MIVSNAAQNADVIAIAVSAVTAWIVIKTAHAASVGNMTTMTSVVKFCFILEETATLVA